jgi:hypothetical protein
MTIPALAIARSNVRIKSNTLMARRMCQSATLGLRGFAKFVGQGLIGSHVANGWSAAIPTLGETGLSRANVATPLARLATEGSRPPD